MQERLLISESLVNLPPYHVTQARQGIVPVAGFGDPVELACLGYGSLARRIFTELLPFFSGSAASVRCSWLTGKRIRGSVLDVS